MTDRTTDPRLKSAREEKLFAPRRVPAVEGVGSTIRTWTMGQDQPSQWMKGRFVWLSVWKSEMNRRRLRERTVP